MFGLLDGLHKVNSSSFLPAKPICSIATAALEQSFGFTEIGLFDSGPMIANNCGIDSYKTYPMKEGTVDWDAYFEFRLNIHASWWSRWYATYREEVGYLQLILPQSVVLLRIFQSLDAPNEHFALSKTDIINAPTDTIKVDFYIAAHNDFLINRTVEYRPVATFIHDALLRLTNKFLWRYFKTRGGSSYQQHQLARSKAIEYVNDISTVKHIIDWRTSRLRTA